MRKTTVGPRRPLKPWEKKADKVLSVFLIAEGLGGPWPPTTDLEVLRDSIFGWIFLIGVVYGVCYNVWQFIKWMF